MDSHKEQISLWYDQYGEAVFKFIFMMIKDYQQAEDLTQETFVKAYVHIDAFQEKATPKTWLFTIAHNLTVDFVRKKKPSFLLKELFKKDTTPLPDEMMQMKEEQFHLYHAIQQLKDSHRKVIMLRKIKEFSIQETADILNWSESKVKSTLFRALHALERQLLKGDYQYDSKPRQTQ
ncbi:RNA polymerase sigma factor [Priestia flexa]|uniref:RNA polymerase sigma factor n=1 Tax=Priestia flexa TaxID=86664 RepID=UPI00099D0562|nr:RNA polymerase sigma factor [Priestia flexa]AQX55737.1 RNA polymerase subunit sigma-24 [Priestia flexa]